MGLIAKAVAITHQANVIHGDLTTSNMMLRPSSDVIEDTMKAEDIGKLYLIDFGLSSCSHKGEDKAVDLYVLKRAMISLHPGSDQLFENLLEKYLSHYNSTEDQ
jgi:TP53 regulating kinase and related kinases